MRVRVDLHSAAVDPGETVRGEVVVLDGGDARGVTARLEFREHAGPFARAARAEAETRIGGALETGDVLTFSLALPPDALPAVETEVGGVRWDLVIRVDRPLRPDLEERVPLVVRT